VEILNSFSRAREYLKRHGLAETLQRAGVVVRRRAGAFVPPATIARVSLALGACLGVGVVMPRVGRVVTPGVALVVGAAYMGVLLVTGEIGRGDLAMVRAMGGRKKG